MIAVDHDRIPCPSAVFPRNPVCAVIPIYNHAATLRNVAEKVLRHVPDVLIVDDGSADADLKSLLDDLPIYYCRHEVNRGKGAALRHALRILADSGYDYMLTLDADGQHDPADLPAFLQLADTGKNFFAIGCRDFTGQPVPGGSRFGRKLSNLLLKLETGIRSADCQSGLRMYPVQLLAGLPFRCSRFDFEAEVLALAAWAGAEFRDLPVKVYYPPRGERITHFRPLPELTRLTGLHLRLLAGSLFQKRRRHGNTL